MFAMQNNCKIAVLVSFSGEGGAERMVINLVTAFRAAGYQVDLLLVKARGAHLKSLPPEVNVIRLGAAHTLTCLPGLVRYLREARPAALLAAKDRASRLALWARRFSGADTRIAIRLGTTMSTAFQGKGPLIRWLRCLPIRLSYHWADEIIATCHGVADDLSQITHIPVSQIRVLPNPTVTPMILQEAREPVAHPWFRDPNVPVILGAGRLTRQKDFPTLIRAFAHLRRQYVCRLVILGEGRRREDLEALASELGVKKDISARFCFKPVCIYGPFGTFCAIVCLGRTCECVGRGPSPWHPRGLDRLPQRSKGATSERTLRSPGACGRCGCPGRGDARNTGKSSRQGVFEACRNRLHY
jgi:glycosyltransferase involved in cell wall biosynthesis